MKTILPHVGIQSCAIVKMFVAHMALVLLLKPHLRRQRARQARATRGRRARYSGQPPRMRLFVGLHMQLHITSTGKPSVTNFTAVRAFTFNTKPKPINQNL